MCYTHGYLWRIRVTYFVENIAQEIRMNSQNKFADDVSDNSHLHYT